MVGILDTNVSMEGIKLPLASLHVDTIISTFIFKKLFLETDRCKALKDIISFIRKKEAENQLSDWELISTLTMIYRLIEI